MEKKNIKKDKESEKEREEEFSKEENDQLGLPQDIDFKKFLGCGG